jgi:hypothetical protein
MPTIIIEKIKPDGTGDFDNLQDWVTALPSNIVTADEIRIAEVYSGGNASDGTELLISGITTDFDHYLEIRVAPGHEHRGTGRVINKNKAYIEINTDTNAIDIRSNYVRITDMQITGTSSVGANTPVIATLTDSTDAQIRLTRCIINKNADGVVCDFRGGGLLNGRENINKACVFIGNGNSSGVAICNHTRVNVSNTGRTRYHNCIIICRGTLTHCFSLSLDHRVRSNNNYFRPGSGGGVVYNGDQADYAKIGGDATSNSEASHPIHKNVAYSNVNFTDTTANAEDLHIVSTSVLANTGDNGVNGPFTLDRSEFVVLEDWELNIIQKASGILPLGSGGYPVGADAIANEVGPSLLGGYILSSALGPVSGFLGGYIEGGPHVGPTGYIGGYVLSRAAENANAVGLLGGYIITNGGIVPPAKIGGFVFSIPVVNDGPEFIGGFASGLFQNQEFIGGFTIGRPDAKQFAATRARTVVAVTSDQVVDQGLEFDARIIFKNVFNYDFNTKLINAKTYQNDINAKVEVQKFRIPPSIFIQSMDVVVPSGEVVPSGQPIPVFDPNGARKVCVTASGTLGDAESWIGAQIDFGDPFARSGGFKPLFSVSGIAGPPPWTACHDYNISGIYMVTVHGRDNDGMVGGTLSGLNLASGAGFGTHFPAISISGNPRMGIVPPVLQVDFALQSSGVSVPPFTTKQANQSQPQSPTDERLFWNFGNRETSRRKNPKTFYASPGLYVPKCIFHYTNPSGGQYIVSDSLIVGFNI